MCWLDLVRIDENSFGNETNRFFNSCQSTVTKSTSHRSKNESNSCSYSTDLSLIGKVIDKNAVTISLLMINSSLYLNQNIKFTKNYSRYKIVSLSIRILKKTFYYNTDGLCVPEVFIQFQILCEYHTYIPFNFLYIVKKA